tara:strand:+ start:6005 stop:6532 length:528 start_codon:yes stop_codon:yes gene_type:complete
MFKCPECKKVKEKTEYMLSSTKEYPILSVCNQCSDNLLIEDVLCNCNVCQRKLPSSYFQHYRTRIKSNGMRLRVNRNCHDCSKKTKKELDRIKKEILPKHPYPEYGTKCNQCNKTVYEKSEDIPGGVNGTNGPWQFDHDHVTNKFRGYVCKLCNTGTGMIGDDQAFWEKANERKN